MAPTARLHPIKTNFATEYSSKLPKGERNYSQDDTDALELDNLLSEILNSTSDMHIFSKESPGIITNGHNLEKISRNELPGGKFISTPENLRHVSVGNKEFGSKTEKSKSNLRETASLNKLKSNQHQSRHTQSAHQLELNKHPTNEILNFVVPNLDIPSQSKKVIQPSLTELASNIISKPQVPISLSGPVNDVAKLSPAVGKRSVNGSEVPVLSLADLAKQHKTQRGKSGSPNEASPFISQKVNDNMASLSALVAQYSAKKNGFMKNHTEHSSSLFDTGENEKCEKLNKPPSIVADGSSPTTSLTNLPMAHTQSGRNSSSVSLSNLAQQHKHSTQSPVSNQGLQANAAKPSLSSLFSNVSLTDNTKSKKSQFNNCDTDISPSLSNQSSTKTAPHLSLQSCLKTSKTSNSGSKKTIKIQQESDVEDPFVGDNPSHVDTESHTSCLYPQEEEIQSDLIAPPSSLGLALCFFQFKRTSEDNTELKPNRPLRYPKFKCSTQAGNREMYKENVYHKIVRFDFSTPSPDDIVISKQKQAFTRPDKEFEL